MAANRLIILLAVIGTLTILLLQNLSPVLPLIFLGMKSKPLPLAIWIILSIATGALTSWLITSLYQLSNYLGSPKQTAPSRSNSRASRVRQNTRQEAKFNTHTAPKTSQKQDSKTQAIEDDWDDNSANDDWDFDESPVDQRRQSSQNQPQKDSRDYERPQQKTSGNQSDSTYSYSSREPKNTGVGKTESVYDADYRVIIPPYTPSPESQQTDDDDDDDDWSFFDEEEDDFDDGERLRR